MKNYKKENYGSATGVNMESGLTSGITQANFISVREGDVQVIPVLVTSEDFVNGNGLLASKLERPNQETII